MPAPAIAITAARIGATLVRGAKLFRVGTVRAVKVGSKTLRRSRIKLQRATKKRRIASARKRRNDRIFNERFKQLQARGIIDIKKGTGVVGGLIKNIIQRPLNALLNLLGAWVLDNLPEILRRIRVFTKRIRVLVGVLRKTFSAIGGTFDSIKNIVVALYENIINFDFSDKSGKIQAAKDQLDVNIKEIQLGVEEFQNVWDREERELDIFIEGLKDEETIKKALDIVAEDIESERAAQPQTPAVGPGSTGSGSTGSGSTGSSTGSAGQRALLDTIAYAEGTSGPQGYNTWFGGRNDLDLSKLTINQVVAEQKRRINSGEATYGRRTSAAVGRYQMLYPEDAAVAAGLDPATAKFTPENQDKMVLAYYIKGQAGLSDAEIEGGINPKIIDKLAPVFASFPNLFGPDKYGRTGTNTSYYGQGGKSKEQITDYYNKILEKNTQNVQPQGGQNQPSGGAQPPQPVTKSNTGVIDELDVSTNESPLGGLTAGSGFRSAKRPTHNGIDIGTYGARGFKVSLNANGSVSRISNDPTGYGKFVIITVPSMNRSFMFAHLQTVYLKQGQKYNGEAIGEIGNTGNSDDVHLHFECYIGGANGQAINPAPYLNLLSIGRGLRKSANSNNINPTASQRATSFANAAQSMPTGEIENNKILIIESSKTYIPTR